MPSRAHRWKGDDHPLSDFHGGNKAAAKAAIAASKRAMYERECSVARQIIARNVARSEASAPVRKDRLRPRAQKAPVVKSEKPPIPSRWTCRPTGRHHWDRTGAPKMVRTLEVTMRQRLMLHAAQEGLCALCGEPMGGSAFGLSLDHVIPRSLGGADGFGNLVLCHGECNGRKTNDTPTGCEMVWLLAINSRLGFYPQVF